MYIYVENNWNMGNKNGRGATAGASLVSSTDIHRMDGYLFVPNLFKTFLQYGAQFGGVMITA